MTKQPIRILDNQFGHSNGGSFGTGDLNILPTHITWWRGGQIGEIVVITESCFHLVQQQKELVKIALIIEPQCINSPSYEWIKQNRHLFECVLTHNIELLNSIPNGYFYMFSGCWIKPEDQAVHQKTKDVSIVASGKKQSIGHNLRHEAVELFGHRIDGIYGRGYKVIENKIEALKDFRYSIAIENEVSDVWVTEKVIDCFATGTIPIYYGTEAIKDYFDEDGILFFRNLAELEQCLNLATPEYYESKRRAIENNFELCKPFLIPEDRLWKSFFKPRFFAK
jgi:hypothetical protein